MDELARRLASGPAIFPHSLDFSKELILLVALDEASLSRASFLDDRVLTPQTWGRWLPFKDVAERISPQARDDAHYIFHTGHVGSTLISRLLGEIPGALALREPLLLRDLASKLTGHDTMCASWDDVTIRANWVPLIRRLLARTFRVDQNVIVKATSFVSDIGLDLIAPSSRTAFLFTSLSSYMKTILAGENSRRELDKATSARISRLAHRLGEMPYQASSLNEGERIALGWATEMLAMRDASYALPENAAIWLDFDRFLARPAEEFLLLASHFGYELAPDELVRIVTGPLMRRYSKAPEYGYSTELRLQLQAQAGQDHHDAICHGVTWFEQAVRRHPRLAEIAEHTN